MSLARKPQSLKDERARLFSEAEGMLDKLDAESRDFTKAEEKRHNDILASIDSTTKMIELQSKGSPGVPGAEPLFPGDNPHAGRLSALSGGTVRAFTNDRAGKEAAYRSGKFLMATLLGDEDSRIWCQNAGMDTDGGIVGVNVKALDGSHGKATVAAGSGHDTLPEIDADDIINLMAAVPTFAKRGSAFVCGPAALEVVFNAIKIAAGGNNLDNLANMVTPRFLGYPVEVTDVYPDDVTANLNGAAMIGFGNLQQACTLGTRREIRLAISTDRYFELDQIGIKATMRHDINIHDLGIDTQKSPFVLLTGTS